MPLVIMAFHEINIIYYTGLGIECYVLCYLISHLTALLTSCISSFQSVFCVLHLHKFLFLLSVSFVYEQTLLNRILPAFSLDSSISPSRSSTAEEMRQRCTKNKHLVHRYPPVPQTVLLTRHPVPWNKSVFISLSGHRLWFTLLTCILTQLRERGLGRLGKWKLERWWLAQEVSTRSMEETQLRLESAWSAQC